MSISDEKYIKILNANGAAITNVMTEKIKFFKRFCMML